MTTCEQIPLDQLKATIQSSQWADGPLYFIGDVGGTNARLGFAHKAADGGITIRFVVFSMSKGTIDQLHEFFKTVLETLGADEASRKPITGRIANGAVSVPGPCVNNQIAGPFNNLKGMAKLSEYPTELFPRGRSALLNDLEAGAFGVLAVSDAGVFSEYFKVMWKGTHWESNQSTKAVPAVGSALGRGRCFVMAPGTGMGTSLVTYNGIHDRYDVLPLEYGSQSLAYSHHPTGGKRYMPYLCKALALKPGYVPNWEHVCSGRALTVNYNYLRSKEGTVKSRKAATNISPGQVARLARDGDPTALKAMAMYFQYIVQACGEAIMTFLPLTCVLIGDNVIKNDFFFEKDPSHVEMLRKTMLQHPMELDYGFLGRTTVLRQVKSVNLNLMGCFGFGLHFTSDEPSAQQPVSPSKL